MRIIYLIFFVIGLFALSVSANAQTYCNVDFSSTADYISAVQFNGGAPAGWTRTSGQASNGYANVTNNSSYEASVEPCKSYAIRVTTSGSGTHYVRVFFDWDDNGSWESNINLGSKAAGSNFNGSFTVPPELNGVSTNGLTTRMRVIMEYNEDPAACQSDTWGEAEDYQLKISSAPAMTFIDVNSVVQNTTAPASKGANNVEIIGFNVKTSGCSTPLKLQSAIFGKASSDDVSNDATQAILFYTGSSSSFSTAQAVGTAVSPSNQFTISNIDVQVPTLQSGDNWFWLAYNVGSSAKLDNYLDAELISISVSGSTKTPTDGDPAGKRLIVNSYCTPSPANQAGAHITKVEIGSLSSTNSGNSLYRSFVSTVNVFDLCVGTDNDLDVSWLSDVSYIDGQVPLFVHAYFDWNRDGLFTGEGEHIFVGHSLSGSYTGGVTVNGQPLVGGPTSGTMSINVTPPQSAHAGPSVMRVVISREPTASPCLGTVDGETEDYGYNLNKAGVLSVAGGNVLCAKKALTLNASDTQGVFDFQSSPDASTWTTITGSTNQNSITTTTINQTTYYRLLGTSNNCPNNEVYSDFVDVPFVGVSEITSSKNQLCTNDTADLSASFEYSKYDFSTTIGEFVPGDVVMEYSLDVTGLPFNRINDAVLESVCLEFGTNSGSPETSIYLVAPGASAESPILLSYGNGGESLPSESESFCFSSDAANSITSETALPSGSYRPEESFDRLKGIDPNGTWKLLVYNAYVDGLMQVDKFSLNFGVNDAITWSPAATVANTSGNDTRAFPTASTQYKASINNRYCTAEDSITLAVLGGNPITVTIDSVTPTGTVCEGTELTFTASLSENISNPPIKWFINNGPVLGTDLTFTTSLVSNGDVVKVEFDLTTPCGNFNSTDQVAVNMGAIVTPSLTLNSNANFPVCAGAPVVFSATASDFGPSPSYEWFVNNVSVQQGGVTYNANSPSNGDVVKVVVSTDYPCATVSSLKDSLTYSSTTELDPKIELTSDVNPELSCAGKMINFTMDTVFNNSGGNGEVKWFVDGKLINVPGLTTSSDTFSTGQHFVRVEYHVSSGCTKASFVSDQVSFEVGDDVIPEIEFTADRTLVCKGDSIEFSINKIVNGGSSPQIQWYKNSTPISGQTGMTFKDKNFNNQDEINVRLISSIECVSFEQAFGDAIVVKISNRTPTEINIASDFASDPFCEGTRVRVDVDYHIGGGVKPDFEWFLNNKRIKKNALEYLMIDTLKSGDKIYAKMHTNSVCPTPVIPVSDTLSFNVNDIPFVDYQAIQVGNEVHFTPNSNDFSSYNWEFGTGGSSIQSNPVYQFNGEGNYNTCLTIIDVNGCSNKKCKKVQYTPVTGINALGANETVIVYPNPSKGVIRIKNLEMDASLQISSTDGKIISLAAFKMENQAGERVLDLSDLSKGVYHLNIQSKDRISNFRITLN